MTSNSKGGDKKMPLTPLKRGIPHPRINSIKHILAEYNEKICFENRAEFHPLWPYSFVFEIGELKRKI